MEDAALFSPDYITARTRFRESAQQLGWSNQSYALDGVGPQGEHLTIDVASSPPTTGDRVLVISSGIHGVEGHFGSAAQLAVMNQWERDWPANVRVVLIHALNPYGFAWSRRVDADNIDPNRNCLHDGEGYSGSPPHYDELNTILNPRRPPTWRDRIFLDGAWPLIRYGKVVLKTIVAGGQYDYPQGLFFGGRGPSQTFRIVQEHLRSWLGPATSVVHFDLHTGLGRWATYQLLLDDPSGRSVDAARHFGCAVADQYRLHGVPYQIRGSFGSWCLSQNLAADYFFAFAEFGTCSEVAVISGLRAENQAHHWGKASSPSSDRTKTRLRELFCPPSPTWRSLVIEQSLTLINRATNVLADRGSVTQAKKLSKSA